MRKKGYQSVLGVCAILILWGAVSMAIAAGGPPLKDNPCGMCHKDFKAILPKPHKGGNTDKPCLTCHVPNPSRTGPNNFAERIHKIHQGEKTKLECTVCHAL